MKHQVRIGLQNDQEVEIQGAGVQAGEPVVVVGNYELKDGMAVKVRRRREVRRVDSVAPPLHSCS